MNMMRLAVIVLATFSNAAAACEFDTDCESGSQCLKSPGNIYGVCAGGIDPGNSSDQKPVYKPLDLNHFTEDTWCSFDLDCGINAKCVKGDGAIVGVCLPKK